MGRGSTLGSLASATCQNCSCDRRMFAALQPASFNMMLRHKPRCASAPHGGHRRRHQSRASVQRLQCAPLIVPQNSTESTVITSVRSARHAATTAAQTAAEPTVSYRGQNAGPLPVRHQPSRLHCVVRRSDTAFQQERGFKAVLMAAMQLPACPGSMHGPEVHHGWRT